MPANKASKAITVGIPDFDPFLMISFSLKEILFLVAFLLSRKSSSFSFGYCFA
jgi:hypothetical protein